MRIICWNVNGIRANIKKGGFEWLLAQNPDIFCLQETKAHPEQLTKETVSPRGYHSYFDHSKGRKGYSGVAIYAKQQPEYVEYGLGKEDLDQEGRQIALFYKDFVVITIYFPNGGGGPERLDFKMRYYAEFLNYLEKIRKLGKSIIFCGDVNTAHQEIDLARPKENEKNTGFLPMERQWVSDIVARGYIDTFRFLNPDTKSKYTWWDMKTFARERNVGWRIDYFFVSNTLKNSIKSSTIHENVLGSDHAPIELELEF
jgi:exodeoxyribonuclease-3